MENSGNPFEAINTRLTAIEALLGNVDKKLAADTTVEQSAPAELLTKKQAAAMLALSASTIDNYARAGIIERIKLGKAVRFRRSDVLALVNSKTIDQ